MLKKKYLYFIPFVIAAICCHKTLAQVTSVGDWTAPAPDSLAEALQNGTTTITLENSLTIWDNGWIQDDSGIYTIFQSVPALADGETINFNLGGFELSGVVLDVNTGEGIFAFLNGTLGSGGANFGIGFTGDGHITLNAVTLNASVLNIGSSSTTALLELTNTSRLATTGSINLTGFQNKLTLANASTLSSSASMTIGDGAAFDATGSGNISIGGDLNLVDGGSFSSTGRAVTIGGNLSVEGFGVWEKETTPVTYDTKRSSFGGSGNLTVSGNMISATDGGKIDLSGYTFGPWSVSTGKSIKVDGVFSHAESKTSVGSELVWTGSSLSVDGGTVEILGGGVMTGVTNITVGAGSTVDVVGALLDADTGTSYRSTLAAGGTLTLGTSSGTGTLNIGAGARVSGTTTITLGQGGAGTLNIHGVDAATGNFSRIDASGVLVVGDSHDGTLIINDGGYLSALSASLGLGAGKAVIDLGFLRNDPNPPIIKGVGTGNRRTTLTLTGNLVADNADITIRGGSLLNVDGTATLGNTAGVTTELTLGTRGGTGSGYSASLKTGGELTVGNLGIVEVVINNGGNITSGGASILGKGKTNDANRSKVTVTIEDADGTPGHYAWVAGGAAVTPGNYVPPEGETKLEVLDGIIRVDGLFAMAGYDSAYTDGYGIASFGSVGKSGELQMSGGSFYNMNTPTFESSSLGKIVINQGGIVSGSGHIYAGEQFVVDGGTIAPGTRWMYHFDHDEPHHAEDPTHVGTDVLESLGHLHIYDHSDKSTEFHDATYRTELDRDGTEFNQTGLADRTTVYGNLDSDSGFTVDISRPLDGKYLLVDTSGGTIANFSPRKLNELSGDSLLLNLNGKLLKGNNRIDYDGGMFTTLEESSTEIWLTVKTTSQGNVMTYWTGVNGTTWDMTAENFRARNNADTADATFTGKEQFLDGDIVYFDFSTVNAANRTVHVTTDAINYSGDMHSVGNVRVAEINVIGGTGADTETPFSWGTAGNSGGSIFALDSALYTTLDRGLADADIDTPSGRFNKIGDGVLHIYNVNEFYGGIHLGQDGTEGGTIILHNEKGLGTYNSTSGYQQKGLVTVHENSTIRIADDLLDFTINNRFIVEEGKLLTFEFPGDFTIANNNALAADAANDGKGGGVFIGNTGQIIYTGSGKLHLNNNRAKTGGGIYTELGYTLQVPAYIEGNYAEGKGGGIFAERFFQLRDGSDISGNVAQGAGGAIYVGNVGTIDTDEDPNDRQFTIHGNTTILNNRSGGEIGGGIYVDAGRELIISTKKETSGGNSFLGGDVWFEGNYANVGFDQDNPAGGSLDLENAIRNSLHLSNKASSGTDSAATLTVSGPYNTYFYDALSGDTGTKIMISGVRATSANNDHGLPDTQYGTVVFRDDSAFYGNTTVSGGATFRLESYIEGGEPVEAVFGRKGSLSPSSAANNSFTLQGDSTITGEGMIAADAVTLGGIVDLDTGTFSRPGSPVDPVTGKPVDPPGLDGSGAVVAAGTMQGTLKLDGEVAVAPTSRWKLTLTNPANAKQGQSDLIDVTGTATFGGTEGNRLTLEVDGMVRGQYTIMTTSAGVKGAYNTLKLNSDAPVFYGTVDLTKKALTPAEGADNPYLGRVIAATYIGTAKTATNNQNHLYLDITGRNRYVQSSVSGNWGDDSSWAFSTVPADNSDIVNTKTSGTWSQADLGPATSTYIDGDMVSLHGGTHTLTTRVNPVDLFVDGTVIIAGTAFGITTFSTEATSTTTVKGRDASTITTVKASNDYEIEGYTGKLTKTTTAVLRFLNTGGNTFTGGIDIGTTGVSGGTIAFTRGDQLQVGADRYIDFLGSGTLNATVTTELTTNIRIQAGQTATFDIDTGVTLTQSGTIGGVGAISKIDTGILALSAQNTFTGGTTLVAGTIRIDGIGGTTGAPNTVLGLYDNTHANPSAGVVDVTGDGTITSITTSRTIRNRFLVDTSGAGLTFGNAAALTVNGVNVGVATDGGAVYVAATADQLIFAESGALTFSGNQARSGGGVYDANAGLLTISKTIIFTGNEALAGSGGGLYAAGAVTVTGATTLGGTGTAAGNKASVDGGGIYADGAAIFAALTAYRNEAASGSGGGVYAISDVTISGTALIGSNNATETNDYGNSADDFGGGIYSGGSISLTGNNAKTIRYNVAGDSGGGLYTATGTVTISGTGVKTMTDNTATAGSGGAIYARNISLTGPATISRNTATAGQGGAFYVDDGGSLTLTTGTEGDITFSDNTASADGGEAAYVGDGGTITIDTGMSTDTTPVARVVRFDDTLVTGTGMTLDKTGEGKLAFTGTGNKNIFHGTTNIDEGTFRITTGTSYGGTGTFVLDQIPVAGSCPEGAFLTGGGTLTADLFELKGVLAPDGGTGVDEVVTGANRFGTLNFIGDVDMYGDADSLSYQYDVHLLSPADFEEPDPVVDPDDYWETLGKADKLDIDGTFDAITDANNKKIVINLHNFGPGRFLLIDATELNVNGVNNIDININDVDGINGSGAFDVLVHDFQKTDRHEVTFLRGNQKIYKDASDTTGVQVGDHANQLWLATQYNNLHMYWNGLEPVEGVRIWDGVDNETNANWNDKAGATGETQFENRDAVVFGETAPDWNGGGTDTIAVGLGTVRSVTIDPQGVTVTNMLVENDLAGTSTLRTDIDDKAYLFNGSGGILTAADYAGDKLSYGHGNAPRMLLKRGKGDLIFANTGANTFTGGIVFDTTSGDDAGTIAFGLAAHLGDGGLGITFNENGTLRSTAAITALTNNLHLVDGKTVAFDTNTFNVTHTGIIDEIGDTSTGNFLKTGAGTLTLNNASSGWQGTTTVSAGTLLAVGVGSVDGKGSLGINSDSRIVTVGTGANLTLQIAGNETMKQKITGTGSLSKTGSGTLTLDRGDNDYTGLTTISGGTAANKSTLIAEFVGSTGTVGGISMNGANTVFEMSNVADGTVSQRIYGTGHLVKSDSGTLTLTGTNNNYTGNTEITGGSIEITNVGAVGANAAERTVSTANGTALEIALSAAGTFNQKITGAGELLKTGSNNSVLTLSAANTFTGGTTLALGGLVLTDASALGAYDTSIASSGRVNVTGDDTTTTLAATLPDPDLPTYKNHFDIGTALSWTLNATETGTLGGFVNASDGGAITLNDDATVTIGVSSGKTLTLSGNTDSSGSNDISMGSGATLNVNGAGNTLIGSGIRGTGTVAKSGAGLLQIGADSVLTGQTNVGAGIFRVLGNVEYGDITAIGFSQTGGTVTGSGTIASVSNSLGATVSPDSATGTAPTTNGSDRFGTFVFDGTADLASTFVFDYDADTSKVVASGADTLGFSGTTGDLLRMQNGDSYTVNDGATINFQNSLSTGKYLIMIADKDFTLAGGNGKLDGIHASGVLKSMGTTDDHTPRGRFEFVWGKNGNAEIQSQIWLDLTRNSLTMDWNQTDAGTYTWGETTTDWLSMQVRGGTRERLYNDGDLVNINVLAATTLNLAANRLIAGLNVGGTNSLTIGGTGFGITAKLSDANIEGEYLLAAAGAEQLVPTGKLVKSGTGTLIFANGANTFNKGIEINAGTIAFSAANQLGTRDTDSTDSGIRFIGTTGELQSNADVTIGNRIILNNGATANFDSNGSTFTINGLIDEANAGDTGAVTKTGTGTVVLANTSNAYAGTTTVDAGTLRALSDTTGTALGNNVATHQVVISNGAELELDVVSGVTATLNQRISGTGGRLEKIGAGEQILTHDNNAYTGGTTVTAGILTGHYVGSFGSGAIINTAALKYDMYAVGTASNLITGAGTFTKTQSAASYDLTLSNTGNDFSGDILVSDGSLTGRVNRLIANDSRSLGDIGDTSRTITLTDAEDVLRINENTQSNAVATIITGGGVLEKYGTGTTTLSAANDFSGGTVLTDGALIVNNASALSATTGTGSSGWLYYQLGTVTDANRIVTVASGIASIRNHLEVLDGPNNGFQNTAGTALTVSSVTVAAGNDGGFAYVQGGAKLTVTANADMTFSDNKDLGGTRDNDFYVDGGGSLEFNGLANTYLNSGLLGTSTGYLTQQAEIVKNGSGILQIGNTTDDVNDFLGSTSVSGGTFRVVQNAVYGSNNAAAYNMFTSNTGTTLGGGGTLRSALNTINGTVSPDNAVFESGDNSIASSEKYATLTFDGDTTFGSAFRFTYDAASPYTETNLNTAEAIAATTGDLVRLTGSANTFTITNGGIIDLYATTLASGSYHIIRADNAIGVSGAADIDAALTLYVNGAQYFSSVRMAERFVLANSDKDVWLTVSRNSLNMVWNIGSDTWSNTGNRTNWESKQGSGAQGDTKTDVFNNGDYVHFTGTTGDATITIVGQVDVAGMEVNSDDNYTFTGDADAKINAADNLASTEGKYLLSSAGTEQLIPDGKLIKDGTGTLTFENTGGNTFEKGIEIKAGTVAFDRADQLGTTDDNSVDNGITFTGSVTGTLQANASAVLTNPVTVAANSVGTIDPRDRSLTFNTGTVNVQNGGTLNLVGTGNQFFNTGIQGTGATLAKSGAGIVQIGANSTFNGATTVSNGTFRVVNGSRYGGTGSFTLNQDRVLAGGGTVRAGTITIDGTISSDTAVLSETKTNVSTTTDERFGILTIEGDVTLSGTFRMEYDAKHPNNSISPTGDLLVVDGNLTVNNGGTINLRNAEGSLTGSYHIVDSNNAITVNGTDIDLVFTAKINDNPMSAHSIRGAFEFNMKNSDTEIWLDVFHNSLDMVWQDSPQNQIWTATGGGANWLSDQGGASPLQQKETVFNNGDYVHFTDVGTTSGNQTIEIVGTVIVAGFEFDATGVYTFTGAGGIYAEAYHATTEGQFLPVNGGTPVLTPDGKLNKFGDGTLIFQNTGDNTFAQGIEISGGTIGFTLAGQLGDGGKGITFLENGTLRADATGRNLGNDIIINPGVTAIFETPLDRQLTLSGEISGNAVEKIGTGRLTLVGTNIHTGLTTISAGTLEAVGVAALGVNNSANEVAIASGAELEVNIGTGSQILNKILTRAGKLEKTGDGELVLSQTNNTYSGGTVVSDGVLTVRHVEQSGNNGGLGTGSVEIAQNAVLNFDILEAGTYSKTIAGDGKVEKAGTHTLTLTGTASDYTGGTEIKGGRITATSENALGDNVASGVVDLSGTGTSLEFRLPVDSTFHQEITGIGTLVQSGPGMLTLSNANTFTGGTQWDGGDLGVTDPAGLSATDGTGVAGFVFVNTDGTFSTDNASDTIRNRFEIAADQNMRIANELTIAANNVTGAGGGAIELESGASFTSDGPLHLTNNTTDGDGGAVYAPTEHITVGGTGLNTVSTLTGNTALNGGGVYAQSVSIKGLAGGSTISGNAATGNGGAFYLVGGVSGNNAVSEVDSTLGSITFQGNTSSAGRNAIHMNEYVTLNIQATGDTDTNQNIYLNDGITSKTGAANGNVIDIDLPYWTESNPIDMRDSGLFVGGVSDYYGDTNLNSGLMFLNANSRFGTIASDNVFTQYADATLAGYGTISADSILLGGLINAGIYTPPPREHEIATLNFIGTTSIGELSGGQTFMDIDLNVAMSQTADLMNVTGELKIAGDSRVDFDTFSVGKFLIARTTDGVTGHTVGTPYYGETSITDFETTIAGLALNPSRFEIVYTLESSPLGENRDIYANLKLNNNYVIWTGANAYSDHDSDQWSFHNPQGNKDDAYDNQWLNDPLYNWHQQNDSGDYITRFRQGDKVAFIGDDPVETVQADFLEVRKNIVIATHTTDNDPTSSASVARVADMLVTNGGTYRFTGAGIEAYSDEHTNLEDASGQLFITGHATAIFANAANNFQRGIVLQNGAVGFNDVSQLETIYTNDTYNGGVTASHGIKVEGENSYGILYANVDDMVLGIVIDIDKADSEMVIDTDGNDFGDDSVTGAYTLTLKHAEIDGHTDPALGTPTPVNGIYGKGRLVKTGSGTLVLAEENTYEGGSVVEEGTLAVAADDRLGKSGTSVLLDGGTLRALASFTTDRAIVISENDGTIEIDENMEVTHTGLLTDRDAGTGIGSLSKTGKGTVVVTNTGNDFQGNLYVEEGRFVAAGLESLGDDDASRTLNTVNTNGVRSVLELRTSDEQTLRQQLSGDGEVRKTGSGQLNLDVDSPNFNGYLDVVAGSVYLTSDFGNGDSFRFQDGTTLSGYGTLGGKTGGVFESGSILAPGNVVADDPDVNPTAKPIHVDGSVTFESGSIYQVVITQHPDPTFDPNNPDRMRPISDCLVVRDGRVTIESGARLEVMIDYWSDNLISIDFGEDLSGVWTIIDTGDNGAANDTSERFVLADIELPRGVEMGHAWHDSRYQLWLIGNPTGAFTEIADTHNSKEVAEVLEELTLVKDPGMIDLIKVLSQKEIDDPTLLDIMKQMAGDLRADSLSMAMNMPWRQAFNRLDRDLFPYVPDPCEPIGCRKIHPRYKREFWGEAYGQYSETRFDGNAFSHRLSRAGTAIGVDRQICSYSLFGIAVNYSEPHMTQRTGKVEMQDVEVGLYNMTKIAGEYDLKSYFGYSHQRYDIRRHVFIPEGNRYDALYETFENKTSGDGFSMSIELLRGFRYNNNIKLTPLIALDYEHVRQDGYTESGGLTALRHDGTSMERLMMRVGLNVKAEVRDLLDLFGRIQYATQLNRTEYPRSTSYFAAATEPSAMDIHGVRIGRDYLNLGMGAEYFFKGTQRATSIYINYDADLWNRHTSSTGNLGFVHRW